MQIEFRFERDEVTLGTDVPPVDETYLTNDNVFRAPRFCFESEPKTGLLFGYRYDGADPNPPDVRVDVYLYDSLDQVWYLFVTEDLSPGQIEYLAFPTTIDRSEDRQCQVTDVAFLVTPLGIVVDGDYHFVSSSTVGVVGDADLETVAEAVHAEDTAHVSGDMGVLGLVVRNDVQGSLVSDDGDYAPLQVDATGALYVTAGVGAPVSIQGMAADDDAAAGNPVQIGGRYLVNEAANPLEDGDIGYVAVNSLRQMRMDLATLIAGENTDLNVLRSSGYGSPYVITAAGTYQVKAGAGVLLRLIYVNVSGAASTLIAYDNIVAAGTVIIPTSSMTTTELPANVPHSVELDIAFAVGLTIVTTGATNVIAVYI